MKASITSATFEDANPNRPHPPTPSPFWGEGEPERQSLSHWERDLG